MIYLDYSATTPVDGEVLDSYIKCCRNYLGNPNSLHKLGVESKKLMDSATEQVANLLGCKSSEVIFTSGASESNNLALIGVCEYYQNRGKHIVTTKLEHSSILETVAYLEKRGYIIDYVPVLENGLIDLEALSRLITKDTILVSIAQVSSEVGILQPIEEIAKIVKNYPTTIFHVDGTQAVGKIPVSLENIDLYSFSAHKFYGMKGIGCLIKKENIQLEPLIHGGKSQSNFRSGTPALPLIVSLSKALRLSILDLDSRYQKVKYFSDLLKKELLNIDGIILNSEDTSIPHIVNLSIPNIKPETMLHALEEKEIYISTKTACSKDHSDSLSLTTMGRDHEISGYSLRVSISHLTTEQEIDSFVENLKECIQKLRLK